MVFRVQTDGYYSVRSRGDLDNNSRSTVLTGWIEKPARSGYIL